MAGNGLARGLSGGGGEEKSSASCPFCFCGRLGRLEEGTPSAAAPGGGRARRRAALFAGDALAGQSRPVPAGAVWLVRAPLSAAPSPLHGGGVEGSGLFWRLGSPPGFPGIFALLSRGRFARRGERGADALLAGGMMGELGPLSGGMRCPFARRESVWAEGRGCRTGSWPAVRGGPGAVPTGGKGPVGDGGGERRSGTAAAGSSAAGGGEGALSQLPAGGAGGGLPMEKGAAVCYND